MRLTTVTHFYESHGGGIERVAGRIVRGLNDAGIDARWCASSGDPVEEDIADLCAPLPLANPVEKFTGLPAPLPGAAALRILHREIAASDGVIIHDSLYATSIAAMMIARKLNRPSVLIQHIGPIPFPSVLKRAMIDGANNIVARRMLGAANQVIFISDTVRRHFDAVRYAATPLLCFNGVDRTVFSYQSRSDMLRQSLGAAPGQKLVLFVGRFVEKKGLSVIAHLARLRPDLKFALIGRGPINPAAWGLANVSTPGELPPTALAAVYGSADVFLLPSVGEGFPLVIQEALACGAPVICGAQAARADPDALKFLTGVDIDLGNPAASASRCARAIDACAADDAVRREASRYAVTTYDWKRMTQAVLGAFVESPVT